MHRLPVVLAAASTLTCPLLALDTAHAQQQRPFTVQELVRLQRLSEPALSTDGRTVVFTLRDTDMEANRGRTDLWSLDIATKGALPRRLTSHPANDTSAQWSADGRYIYFLSTRSGSNQVWRLGTNGGEAEQVTNVPLDIGTFKLAPTDTQLAITVEVFADCADFRCTKERLDAKQQSKSTGLTHDRLFIRHWDAWSDGRVSRLFAYSLKNGLIDGAPVALSGGLDADIPAKPFGDATDYTFSPDATKVAFATKLKGSEEAWSTNFDLYEVATAGGELRNLTPDNPAWDAQPIYSPDGSMLAWRAMTRPGFEADRFHVVVLNLKTGDRRVLTQSWDRSVDAIAFARDSKTLYATADHFGQHPLWSIELKTGKPTMLSGPGHVDAFSVGEREIVFGLASLKSPAELYAVNLRGGELRELPKVNGDALAGIAFGEPEQFTFAGADDQTVYAYVVKPANFDPKRKYPLAFIIHGGPQVSFGNAWSYRWNPQTYAGAGYATVFVDFHGSPGYGQAFTDSISGDWGGKPLIDLQRGLAAALEKYPWLDADRTCALGASYGGYMVNWIAGNWPEPFKCLVTHAGIFDNRSMAYTTEELWFDEWENQGVPFEVPENYEKHNPINHVAKWQKPMLVIHGQLDYRVPYAQGVAAFTAAQRRKIPSRLLIFPEENHWILKPANSIQWHEEVLHWLGRWTGTE
jgi:dipeptidyl aminopeptidase/acylaminoacyl peptidase